MPRAKVILPRVILGTRAIVSEPLPRRFNNPPEFKTAQSTEITTVMKESVAVITKECDSTKQSRRNLG